MKKMIEYGLKHWFICAAVLAAVFFTVGCNGGTKPPTPDPNPAPTPNPKPAPTPAPAPAPKPAPTPDPQGGQQSNQGQDSGGGGTVSTTVKIAIKKVDTTSPLPGHAVVRNAANSADYETAANAPLTITVNRGSNDPKFAAEILAGLIEQLKPLTTAPGANEKYKLTLDDHAKDAFISNADLAGGSVTLYLSKFTGKQTVHVKTMTAIATHDALTGGTVNYTAAVEKTVTVDITTAPDGYVKSVLKGLAKQIAADVHADAAKIEFFTTDAATTSVTTMAHLATNPFFAGIKKN